MAQLERVGIIGLGRMGGPIARRVRDGGFDVSTWDTRVVSTHDSAAELATTADVLVTVLPGSPELRDVMLGTDGALAAMAPGALWLDLTSADPRVAREIAEAATARGVHSVGAPMGGGPKGAEAGELSFFVGGAATSIDRVRPILDLLGARIQVMGDEIGAGYTTKLLANTLWFGQAIAVAEALLLGQAQGIELRTLRDALEGSAGGSAFISEHLAALFDGDYLATFGIDRVVEELEAVRDLATEAGTPAELTGLVTQTHRDALAEFGAINGELLGIRLLELRAGRSLRP